jgi:hypothetical protein
LGNARRGIELERELQPVGIVFATHKTVVGFIAAQGLSPLLISEAPIAWAMGWADINLPGKTRPARQYIQRIRSGTDVRDLKHLYTNKFIDFLWRNG